MCKGAGLKASEFKFTELGQGAGDIRIFNGKNRIFANRFAAVVGSFMLQITGIKPGGCYVIRITKNTASNITVMLPAGSIASNGGSGAIALAGASGSKHILSFINDGTNNFFVYAEDYT